MASSEYIILQRLPTPQNYHDLRKLANLTPPPLDVAPKALNNSFASFLAFERKDMVNDTTPSPDQLAVGMGRLIGDGALFLQLCDVAVHPDHQGKRIGKSVMKALVEYADEHAPRAYISLIAEPLGQGLYSQYGFEDVEPSIGMYRCHFIQNNREAKRAREAKSAAMLRK